MSLWDLLINSPLSCFDILTVWVIILEVGQVGEGVDQRRWRFFEVGML